MDREKLTPILSNPLSSAAGQAARGRWIESRARREPEGAAPAIADPAAALTPAGVLELARHLPALEER